jgi:hypothetical protein
MPRRCSRRYQNIFWFFKSHETASEDEADWWKSAEELFQSITYIAPGRHYKVVIVSIIKNKSYSQYSMPHSRC